MHVNPQYGDCPIAPGDIWYGTDPSNSSLVRNEAEYLGKTFTSKGADGKLRHVKIVKNTSGGAINAGDVLRPSTTVLRKNWDVLVGNADQGPCAGVVCDRYTSPVPADAWFRMTVYAEDHQVRLAAASSVRATLAVGDVVVPGAAGDAWLQNTVASNNAVQNRVGFANEATTDGVDNDTLVQMEINLLR